MGSDDEVITLQAIDGTGDFKLQDLEGFSRTVRLAECGLSYAVVSIMGPQSSGKSTLLNHLFGTKFKEMDALRGRTQTTQGVWLAKAKGVEPTTLVFDLEGTDGRERGEDDTTFEKQSSLFALAVSDIVLINMWCHDIGREQAANKPLLKTVFQVMMRLFTPRRTLLLFVIRDKTRTPLSTLEPILREDIQKIWDSVPKPKGKDLKISDFFQVEVTTLPNFELKEDEFHQAVIELRDRFQNSISPGGLAGDRRGAVPGTAFCLSTSGIWNVIKENKDLDLPAHKVMVATVRCEEIANEKYANLLQDEGWLELEAMVKLSTMFGFGKRAGALLSKTMDEYDAEATYFDETVREEKRKNLLVKALELLEGAFQANLKHKRLAVMDKFQAELGAESNQKSDRPILFAEAVRACTAKALSDFQVLADDSFVEGSGWDVGRIRDKLKSDLDKYVMQVRTEKLGAISLSLQKRLVTAVADPVGAVLEAGGPDTWPSIRQLLAKETADIVKAFEKAVKGFELKANMEEEMKKELIDSGRQAIIKKTKEEAAQAAYRMKDRFNTIFARDKDSMPRVWTGKEDIKAITKDARTASLKLLSTLAVARLDSTVKSSKTDVIENALLHLMEAEAQAAELSPSSSGNFTNVTKSISSVFSASDSGDNSPVNVLASSSWPGVDAGSMMLSPSQCRNLWRMFKTETEYTISQALQAQELARKNNSWLPPKWAVIAMLVLGFNEMMAVVRNPFLAIFLLVFFFLAKALFVQLDIVGSFSHGFLPGMLTISTRLVPASMAAMRKLCEDVPAQIASGPQRIQSFIQSQAGAGKPEKTEKGEIAMQQFAEDSGSAQPNPNTAASDNLRQRNPYAAHE